MSLQRTSLTKVLQLAAAPAAVYTLPAATKACLKGILLHNTGAAAEHVVVHWVQPGASSAAANRILSVDLLAGETLIAEVPFALVITDEGEAICGASTTAATVNICLLGDIDQ